MSEWQLRKPFTLATYGTSLTTGRLSAMWPERLYEQMRAVPECVGPVQLYNMGKGSQTSQWGVDNAQSVADINPSHILTETFAINDCVVVGGVPTISQADNIAHMQAMHDTWKARNAAVDITWQTMNGVSTDGMPLRPNLPDYYAAGATKATAMGDSLIDNYAAPPYVPPGPAGGWIKPLPNALTNDGDGLHPIWSGADEIYLFPSVLYIIRRKMAAWWGLPTPDPPEPPVLTTFFYEVIGSGGSGPAGQYGGGAGAADVKTGVFSTEQDVIELIVAAPAIGGALPSANGKPGASTFLLGTPVGDVEATGGGFGGAGFSTGGDGASGGGSGRGAGGVGQGTFGEGNNGGQADSSGGGGGGGGKSAVGANATAGGPGQGGAGVDSTVPAASSRRICAGGPGAGAFGTPPYPAGGGNPGSGGRCGGSGNPGDDSPAGEVTLWYLGAQTYDGGVVTSFGGYTIHTFDTPGAASLTRGVVPPTSTTLDFSNPAQSAYIGN